MAKMLKGGPKSKKIGALQTPYTKPVTMGKK
jgi:hypothetical protein